MENSFNLYGLRRLLNNIDATNMEEIGDLFLESLTISHGGLKGDITYFQFTGWDLDVRKKNLTAYFKNGKLLEDDNLKKYGKKFPKTREIILSSCYKILEEIVKQGINVDSVNTLLKGEVEFVIMSDERNKKELRGGYFWSETYDGFLL